MERTYTIRRFEILTNPKPVKILLNMYPPLKEYNEVIIKVTCKTELCPSKRKPTLQVKSYYWDN